MLKRSTILAILILVTMSVHPIRSYAASTVNLKNASAMFGVKAGNVIKAKDQGEIEYALKTAGDKASAKRMYIVYAPSGTYKMTKPLTIPANVVFVAEPDSKFSPVTADGFNRFFMVKGSLYGGSYDGKKMAYYCLRLENTTFYGMNGYITHTAVKNSKRAGIIAVGSKNRNGYILNNTVSGCGNSGISAIEGAWLSSISGNICKGNFLAGINLGHANADIINDNTLTGNTGHGISTNTDESGQGYCHIHKIMNNTIRKNGFNGVYMDENCYVDQTFSGNTITSNKTNGVGIDPGGYIKGISGNTISGNSGSGIRVYGNNSIAYIKGENTISGNGTNNITILDNALARITGSGNLIRKSKGNGVSLKKSAAFIVSRGSNKIYSNKGFGIRAEDKCSVIIKNVTFSKNGGESVRSLSGCTVVRE